MADGWTVDDVADHIRRKVDGGRRCALLIGAGCSYQAGIPLASGFVDEIRTRFPREYGRAAEQTYPACMGELDPSDRHELICKYIDAAKINWAHISIAQMMRAGIVDRVLTTNFDPLVVRACALLNLYPAVYDMAVVRKGFLAEFVRDRAIFHLHGQRDGFVQLHRKQDVDLLAEAIEPLFDDTARDRTWIVIGYSGANDPVFRVLADRPDFPNRLFWVGFRDEPPAPDVRTALIEAGKNARWISGYDPDTFLLQLAFRLGCFPPGFFARPFSHLLELFGLLAGFRLPGQDVDLDWAARARGWIEQAITTYEQVPAAVAGAPAPEVPAPDPGARAGTSFGTVKWFNMKKGFGFIQPEDGSKDVFVHISAVERSGLDSLREGQRIQFNLERGQQGKSSAVNLAPTPTTSPPPPPPSSTTAAPALEPERLTLPGEATVPERSGVEPERGGVEPGREISARANVAPTPLPPPAAPEGDVVGAAWVSVMSGDYDPVLDLWPVYQSGAAPGLAEPLAGALAAASRERAERAKTAPEAERQALLLESDELARRCESIRPDILAPAGGKGAMT